MLMTLLGRQCPDLPAELLFSDSEIEVLNAYAKKRMPGRRVLCTPDIAAKSGYDAYGIAQPGRRPGQRFQSLIPFQTLRVAQPLLFMLWGRRAIRPDVCNAMSWVLLLILRTFNALFP